MNPLEKLVGATITKPLMRRRLLKDLEKLFDHELSELGGELRELSSPDNWGGPLNTMVKVNSLTNEIRRGGALKRLTLEINGSGLNLPHLALALESISSNIEEMTRGINRIYEMIREDPNLTVSSILSARMSAIIDAIDAIEDWRDRRRKSILFP